ncbi:MAG TPA: DUF1223 domain-containing protein [Steroidobacter sp.]|uniref:DUF1223 domain-containing protein n=1 Tax=Steroidobacter sp. TaxID=1978227 RepID=UPI002EDA51E8
MSRLVSLTLAALVFSAGLFSTGAVAQPVVVELFTSQGCSSCPPADALLGELARRPGIVALAYHVDYWDDLGWKDRYSIPAATQRQQGYVKRLSRAGAFTPQVVVSGDTSLVGSNRTEVERAIKGDRDALGIKLSRAGGNIQVQFTEAWAGASREPMDVYLVSYLAEATDKIASGENARRTLKHFNVVRSFKRLGAWNGKPQQMTTPMAGVPGDATGVAVILQRKNQGAIAGAATLGLR